MNYIVLASGSSGNATLIIGKSGILLIDFGISKKKLLTKLAEVSINIEEITALLITHSHGDHLLSEEAVEALFPLENVYCSYTTFPSSNVNYIDPLTSFKIADFDIFTIPLSHDRPTLGFIIIEDGEKLTYITDTGYLNNKFLQLIEDSTYYLLEANYDEKMLFASGRTQQLIKRIVSPNGHLSNNDAGEILKKVITPKTKAICLMHISKDCNSKKVALQTINDLLKEHPCYNNLFIHASDRVNTTIKEDYQKEKVVL